MTWTQPLYQGHLTYYASLVRMPAAHRVTAWEDSLIHVHTYGGPKPDPMVTLWRREPAAAATPPGQ